MAKGKHKGRRRVATTSAADLAVRHDFDGGYLGHDTGSTYSLGAISERLALGVDVAFACVQRIADAIADADKGEWNGTIRLRDSRLTRRPMATMTRREWYWRMTATMALYSAAPVERILPGYDADGSISLEPLRPDALSRIAGDLRYTDPETGITRILDPRQVRYARRHVWPTLGIEASAVLKLARDTFAASWAAGAYRSDFWENGGAPSLILTTDQELIGTQAAEVQTKWIERRQTNPGAPAVLGKGLKAATLGADIAAEGASSAASILGASVARYFGMPPSAVNVRSEAGSLTYTNTAEAGLDLVRYTLSGYRGPLEDLLSDEWDDPDRVERIALDHLTRPGMGDRFAAWAIAADPDTGWMRRSEIRAAEGLAPDPTVDLPRQGAPAPDLERITA